jgi:hypothetical protein
VSERDVRRELQRAPIPEETEAGERSWEILRAAFGAREPVRWQRKHRGFAVAFAAAALLAVAVLVAVLTPPGQAVVDRFRDAVGRTPTEPALVRLPAPGRLLVLSPAGPWVVHQDGSKRLLGDYGDASWSPRGLYVVAAQGQHLVALDAETGEVRWSLARNAAVRDPRWSGGGFDTRIAYRAGSALHVVAGDGSPDALLAEGVAPVAPAWRGDSHMLAYADSDGHAHVVDVDSSHELWSTPHIGRISGLDFFGAQLVVSTPSSVIVFRPHRRSPFLELPSGHELLEAIVLPYGGVLYADYEQATDTTALYISDCTVGGTCLLMPDTRVFQGAGQIGNLAVSPDGRWLAAGWEAADQLLFFRRLPRLGKVVAVSDATREFAPGGESGGAFPILVGWAPPAP